MKIVLHVRDEAGWPIMTVDPVAPEKGDRGVRIVNYAQERAKEVTRLCELQREYTREAKATGKVRSPSGFFDIWRKALEEVK